MAFSFGSTGTTGFGAATATPASSAPPTFGFGTSTPAAATTTGVSSFGALTFGAPKTTASGFGFGTTTTASTSGLGAFSFGTTPAATTTTTSLFGFNKPAPTATNSFSFGTTTTQANKGFNFGTLSQPATGGFGATTGGLFGAQQQPQQQQLGLQQQQHQQNAILTNMASAVSLPTIFGDERDGLIAKWNQIQAFWGTGKGYFSQNAPAIDFSAENPFCRFKAVGYSCLPTNKNEDGLVALIFKKKHDEVSRNQQQVVDSLNEILGSKPNVSVCVEGLKPLPDDKSELIVYVLERQPIGTTKRHAATDLYNYLNQAAVKQKLMQPQLSVENIFMKTGFTSEQLKQYLDSPPAGIDPLIWDQAKLDNPDPSKLIPVPMIGFSELHRRLQHQEQQTKLHQNTLDDISQCLAELQRKHSNMAARSEQYKRKYLELGHRVLKVMVKQEIYRKLGYGIQADEEQLRVMLEAIQAELNAPTQFKGRLNELMSQIRMQNQMHAIRPESSYQIDGEYLSEIKQHLSMQQEGLQHLIGIIKDDARDIITIENGLSEAQQNIRRT
ncbi:nucleoporin p54-like [Tubulanus polymorphus]|uniref:nucleoporin p54-like n=1 Tax=Tubulanus polymorphus TaxID=672921 RepID=UPI003DA28784